MHKNLLNLLCKKNNTSYIIFNKNFTVSQVNNISIEINSDIRDFLWEIVGIEENIISLDITKKSIQIPMISRDNNYYDLDIDTFISEDSETLYIAYMQEKSQQTYEYAKVIKEINKKTLIYETSDEKKHTAYYKQINKRLMTFHVDLDGMITTVNDTCSHFFNIEKNNIVGKHFSHFFHTQKSQLNENTHIFSAKDSMGKNIFFHADIIPLTDTRNKIYENIIIAQDVTYLKQIKKELEYASQHDTLTGLPNRHYFLKQIDRYIEKELSFTLCFIDIDSFRRINEEYGAHAGDMLLKHITSLLSSTIESDDLLVRVYGDLFAILFEENKNRKYLNAVVEKLKETVLSHPLIYTVDDIIKFNYTSLLLDYPGDIRNTKELLGNAQKHIKKIKIDKRLTR